MALKFIATDLDGTLLDEAGRLPEQIFPPVKRLLQAGILFAPASGRQCANLELLFAPVKDELIFIAENGAIVRRKGKTLYLNPLTPKQAGEAIKAVRACKGLYPILCCESNGYIETGRRAVRLALTRVLFELYPRGES